MRSRPSGGQRARARRRARPRPGWMRWPPEAARSSPARTGAGGCPAGHVRVGGDQAEEVALRRRGCRSPAAGRARRGGRSSGRATGRSGPGSSAGAASRPPGGRRTPRMWSPALAEASRWLTGQMPQMRAVMPGISQKGRPSQKRSKPRNSVTWKRASATSPGVVQVQGDLGVPLDAGHRVDHDPPGHRGLLPPLVPSLPEPGRRRPSPPGRRRLQQRHEGRPDAVGRGRAARQVRRPPPPPGAAARPAAAGRGTTSSRGAGTPGATVARST